MKEISVKIDKLTNSILNRISGDVFNTEVIRIENHSKFDSTKWNFDWKKEVKDNEVYKLAIENNPDVIQGLISLSDKSFYIFVNLIENAYFNIGKNKIYEGVAGNLFAFACKLSMERGYYGEISFHSKTNLINHYKKNLGAERVGDSTLMLIRNTAAIKLINNYYG